MEARNAATSKRRGFVVWVSWCAHTHKFKLRRQSTVQIRTHAPADLGAHTIPMVPAPEFEPSSLVFGKCVRLAWCGRQDLNQCVCAPVYPTTVQFTMSMGHLNEHRTSMKVYSPSVHLVHRVREIGFSLTICSYCVVFSSMMSSTPRCRLSHDLSSNSLAFLS